MDYEDDEFFDYDDDFDLEEELDPDDDGLFGFFRHKREEDGIKRIMIINPLRMKNMIDTARLLTLFLEDVDEKAKPVIDFKGFRNFGRITVELDRLFAFNASSFASIVSRASGMNIFPLNNGKFLFELTFSFVLMPVNTDSEDLPF